MQKAKPGYKLVKSLFGKEIEIPEEWEVEKLENISKIIDSLHITPKYSNEGYAMVRSTDIKYGNLNLEKTLRVSKEIFKEFTKKYIPKKSDILMSRVGTYGVVSYVNTDEQFCLGQNTVVIETDFGYFIYLSLSSNLIKKQIETVVDGSTQKTITLRNIQKLKLFIPPKNEQQKITSIISNVDNLIHNTDKLIEKTTRLKKGLMQELLTRGIGHDKFKNVTLVPRYLKIQIPNMWNLSNVDSLTINHNSGIFKNKEFYGTGDNIVGVSDLYQHTKIDGQIFKLVRLTDEEKKNKILEEGDLIYGESSLVRTGIGKTLIVTKNGEGTIFAWHTRRIKIKKEFSPNFIYYMLDSQLIRNSIVNRATTTALTGITTKDFFGTRIPLPPLSEQQQIASILSNVDEKISELESKKKSLESLKKGLMQKLLTGKLRVAA